MMTLVDHSQLRSCLTKVDARGMARLALLILRTFGLIHRADRRYPWVPRSSAMPTTPICGPFIPTIHRSPTVDAPPNCAWALTRMGSEMLSPGPVITALGVFHSRNRWMSLHKHACGETAYQKPLSRLSCAHLPRLHHPFRFL